MNKSSQLLSSGAVFDCRTAAAMSEAYDKACHAMRDWSQPEIIKEIIAKRIIGLAWRGERDPDRLCERALKFLGYSEVQLTGQIGNCSNVSG
jgi:hypothetical protein